MRPLPFALAAFVALAGCGGKEEPVANRFERQQAEIENKAKAYEAQVENEVSAYEARLENETDAFLNAAAANGASDANAAEGAAAR